MVIASLQDITSTGDGSYIAKLRAHVNVRSKLELQLSVDADNAKVLMATPSGEENRYAVIAQIIAVLPNDGSNDYEGDSRTKHISVAIGRCLDVLPLGHYTGDYMEMLTKFKMPHPQKQ